MILTRPFSTSLVVITITRVFSCQTICQKSLIVVARHPWVAMYTFWFPDSHRVFYEHRELFNNTEDERRVRRFLCRCRDSDLLSRSCRWCNLNPQHSDQRSPGQPWCRWLVDPRGAKRSWERRASVPSNCESTPVMVQSQMEEIARRWKLTGKNILVSVFGFVFRPLAFLSALLHFCLQLLKSLQERRTTVW